MKVYVIIPIYNVEKYLPKCIDSVFNQLHDDDVHIIPLCVNDGTKDNSVEILQQYKEKHPELIILNKINGGLSSARNFGLDYIKNDQDSYFIFLDSDDYLENDYIQKHLDIAQKYNSDVVCTHHINVEEGNEPPEFEYTSEVVEYSTFESVLALFSGEINSHGPCKLYKTQTWNNVRYDESVSFMEDQRTEFKVFLDAKKVVKYDYCGYYYLHRIGSLCQSKMTNKKIIDALNAYIYTFDFDYSQFANKELKRIKEQILQQFANVYLMMFGRFDKNDASEKEISQWNEIKRFRKSHKAILKFKPKSFKQFIKKIVFLCFPFWYKKLFSLFLKEYDN